MMCRLLVTVVYHLSHFALIGGTTTPDPGKAFTSVESAYASSSPAGHERNFTDEDFGTTQSNGLLNLPNVPENELLLTTTTAPNFESGSNETGDANDFTSATAVGGLTEESASQEPTFTTNTGEIMNETENGTNSVLDSSAILSVSRHTVPTTYSTNAKKSAPTVATSSQRATPKNATTTPTTPVSSTYSLYPSMIPTSPPSISPSSAPTFISYHPGNLTTKENGMLLSEGLVSKLLARRGKKIQFANNQMSRIGFHARPDGAHVFEHPNRKGWVYVSNAESVSKGGVGALTFDEHGNIVNYTMILENTKRNCQGGVTPWNTWVSCEEFGNKGQCHETDPFGVHPPQQTRLGGQGGNFEAFACDNRDPHNLRCFVTNDKTDGELRRFTPDRSVVNATLFDGENPWNILTSNGTLDYLVLHPDQVAGPGSKSMTGNFSWTSNLAEGRVAAKNHFRKCEGMDIDGGILYVVSSSQKEVIALDLDKGTYKTISTFTSESFDGQPDILHIDKDGDTTLYFTEERRNDRHAGVHALDANGHFYTVLKADTLEGDITGLAFSPDNTFFYVAFQRPGLLFVVHRKDGRPFHGKTRNLRHHAKRDAIA